MKKKLTVCKGILALVLMSFLLIFTTNFVFSDDSSDTAMEELYVHGREDIRMRNEQIRLNIEIQGKANKIPVLMYHHILTQKEINDYGWTGNNSILSLEDFKEQMDYLKANDFYTLTLDELEEYRNRGKDLPKKVVLITFDDGYLSNAIYAYPIMREYGFKGVIFMMGKISEIGPSSFLPEKIQFLSNEEIEHYADVFEYGSHTYSMHPKVNGKTLFVSSTVDETREDIKINKELYNTRYIAYPHGEYNQGVIKLLIEEDYKLGFTVRSGYVNKRGSAFKLNRFGINPNTGIEKFQEIVNGKSK